MVLKNINNLQIALSDRSSRELSKSFEIFEKSSLSSEIQLLKVDEISEISGSGPGSSQDLREIDLKMSKKNIEICIAKWKFQNAGCCSTCPGVLVIIIENIKDIIFVFQTYKMSIKIKMHFVEVILNDILSLSIYSKSRRS